MKSRSTIMLAVWAATGVFLWVYWSAFVEIADKWARRPEYSHGWMVVLFALYLLAVRRDTHLAKGSSPDSVGGLLLAVGGVAWLGPWLFEQTGMLMAVVQWAGLALSTAGFSVMVAGWIGEEDVQPNWWGLPVLLVAIGVRLAAAEYFLEWFDFLSMIPFLIGLVLLIGGWRVLRWSWVPSLFLFFMIPLPFTFEVWLRGPLRNIGTLASTYVMQTMGLPAFSERNVVIVGDVEINVVEACSGLRMMMVFFALSVGLAIVLERPIWQRLLIAASAIPIALITNITRIVVTGLLYVWGYDELAKNVFHDLAGWLMPPMGLALLGLELWYLDRLFIVDEKIPLSFGMKGSAGGQHRTAH